MRNLVLSLLSGVVFCACASSHSVSPWASADSWYHTGVEVNDDYADVIYFVSTEVLESRDSAGCTCVHALLTPEERAALTQEMAYIHDNIYPDSLNFFSPYYHQVTFESLSLPGDTLKRAFEETYEECLDAFNYYLENLNNGRPFILAGFSQGAMIVKHLLKNMGDSQYENLVAAYVIGYELNAEDLLSPHIFPASCANDRGVTVSFNSVCSLDCVWDLVCPAPVACINPVNWRTDSTAASLRAGDFDLTVSVDTSANMVLVSGYGDNPPKPFSSVAPWPTGNLHSQEIVIYAQSLRRNALERAYR